MGTSALPAAEVKPRWRGVLHQAAFFAACGAGPMLVLATPTARTALAAAIFAATLALQLGVSALYHRIDWQPGARRWWRRLDHAAIFLLIAGSYTPFGLLAPAGAGGEGLLRWVWLGALVGVLRATLWPGAPRAVSTALYLALGWVAAAYLPLLQATLAPRAQAVLVAGGLLYTLGAACYALGRPNPWPGTFGYHEVFHACVVLAAVCHFGVITLLCLHPG